MNRGMGKKGGRMITINLSSTFDGLEMHQAYNEKY